MHNPHEILEKLESNGQFEAYTYGGCNRDLVPSDYDIITNCDYIEALFPFASNVNGTFVFKEGEKIYNIKYAEDIFSPDNFDFSINAILKDAGGNIKNPFNYEGGQNCLTPVAENCFFKDPIRVLRALRFISKGYIMSLKTAWSMRSFAYLLQFQKPERLRNEFEKLIRAGGQGIDVGAEFNCFQSIMPELQATLGVEQSPNYHPEGDVLKHTGFVVSTATQYSKIISWAALFHDLGKPHTHGFKNGKHTFYGHEFVSEKIAAKYCEFFGIGATDRKIICNLVRNHMKPNNWAKMKKHKRLMALKQCGPENLLALHLCDRMGRETKSENIIQMEKDIELLNNPIITGKDILDAGYEPGPRVGNIINEIMSTCNTREEALTKLNNGRLRSGRS